MGYPTKVQRIKRKNSEQWYIILPAPVAQAMRFTPSEVVEWIIEDRKQMILRRRTPPPSAMKKKGRKGCSNDSTTSGDRTAALSNKRESGKGRKHLQ